jgi:hypothetical protein
MGYSFDGPSKIINLTLGTTSIDVDDMWSRWCDWLVLSDNSKYLPAMRFVGGDAVSDTKNLGITFFMINDWRIRPQEASHRLTINGNLYTDPSGFSPFVDTLGDFNVLTEMQVSSLVDSSLAQLPEIEQASFGGRVTINTALVTSGTAYPLGTGLSPVGNLADAKTIATARGFDSFYIIGNMTFGATDVVSNLNFYGQGATFNVKKTTITLTAGCTTSNTHYYDLMIQGQQGGESNYNNCVIGALTKAHCHYEDCKMVGPVSFSSGVGSTHTTDLVDCYTSTSEYVVDAYDAVTLAYSQLKQVYINFVGKIKFINFQNAGSVINLNISSGEVIIDSSCTAGTFNIRGNAVLTNNSGGSVVRTEGLVTENFTRVRHAVEMLRPSHPGFGTVFYVDAVNGRDTNDGLSYTSPLLTFAAAHTLAVSGRGDVIQFIAPGTGSSTCTENIVITKEDIQVRGPGRGQDIKPAAGIGVDIQGNNCSLSGVVVRSATGSSDDNIVITGKFSRLQDLYVVGADTGGVTPVGTGSCVHYKAGDYHKIINCELEKAGAHGIKMTDISHVNGSPREILIECNNIYYNRDSGIYLSGISSNSTRLLYIENNRIQHNSQYGVYIGANSSKTVVRSTNWIRDNGTYPGNGAVDPTKEIYVDPGAFDAMIDVMPTTMAKAIRTELATELSRIDMAISDIGAATAPTDIENALAVRAELAVELARIDAAITSRLAAGIVQANVKQVNDRTIYGTGTDPDPFRETP